MHWSAYNLRFTQFFTTLKEFINHSGIQALTLVPLLPHRSTGRVSLTASLACPSIPRVAWEKSVARAWPLSLVHSPCIYPFSYQECGEWSTSLMRSFGAEFSWPSTLGATHGLESVKNTQDQAFHQVLAIRNEEDPKNCQTNPDSGLAS